MTNALVASACPVSRIEFVRRLRTTRGWIMPAPLVLMAFAAPAWALAPGEDGVTHLIAVSGIADAANAAAVDPGGNLVLAGGGSHDSVSVLARMMPSGDMDVLNFGTGSGIAIHDLSMNAGDSLRALVRTDDGHYVGCGTFFNTAGGTSYDFVVARFNSDGSLDGTFNSLGTPGPGYVVTAFAAASAADQCNAVAVQTDGMIVSAGYTTSGGHPHVALTRYTALGQPDANFGTGGKVVIDASASQTGDSAANALVLQSNGQLLIAGYALGPSNIDFLVMRLNGADGSPDASFGTGGITRTPIGTSEDIANAMVLQPNGRIVLAGSTYAADGHRHFGLARYTTAGILDPEFSGGKVTTPVGPSDDYAYSLLLMPWGRLVAAGSARINTSDAKTDMAVVAYNADGSLDKFFGVGGMRMVQISTLADAAYGLASDISGARFWAVGTTYGSPSTAQDFVAVEFGLPDTIFRHGFDTNTAP
jgi:uncharacterized delta-60 repeat protein